MKNEEYGKYCYTFEKPILPNALDIISKISYIPTKIYKISKKTAISLPKKSLELIASKTAKSICKAEEIEDSD